MTRIIIAAGLIAAFLAVGWATVPTVSAQAPSVCLNLAPGEHAFQAPSREREGDVTFRVEVGEGGLVTEFYEPGGRPIGAAAFPGVFTGADAYPLPDGVSIVDCPWSPDGESDDSSETADGEGAADAGGAVEYCTSLEPGSTTETISSGGRSYEVTINVGEGGRLIDVEVLGQTYAPQAVIDLLAGFGASFPDHLEIAPCEAAPATADTGSAGLVESGGTAATAYVAVAVAALAVGGAAVAARRRIRVRALGGRARSVRADYAMGMGERRGAPHHFPSHAGATMDRGPASQDAVRPSVDGDARPRRHCAQRAGPRLEAPPPHARAHHPGARGRTRGGWPR